jgi:arsenate reductase
VRKAVALLNDNGIEFSFRDYEKNPLSAVEIEKLLKKLKMSAAEVLRKNDKAYKTLGLTGKESDKKLIRHMAAHPGLLNRPIGVRGRKAVLGRPPEKLLEI